MKSCTINFNEKLSETAKAKFAAAIDKAAAGLSLYHLNIAGRTIKEYFGSSAIQINQKVLSFIVNYYKDKKHKKGSFSFTDRQIANALNKIGVDTVDSSTGELITDHSYFKAKTINASIQTLLDEGLITIEHTPINKCDAMNPNGWVRRTINVNVKEVIKLYITLNYAEIYKAKSFKKTACRKRLFSVDFGSTGYKNKSSDILYLYKLIQLAHKQTYKDYLTACAAQDNDFCINYFNRVNNYYKDARFESVEEQNRELQLLYASYTPIKKDPPNEDTKKALIQIKNMLDSR